MEPSSKSLTDRPPVASGRFYSAHADKLEIEIANMVQEAKNLSQFELAVDEEVIGLIAPHAGYVFSGIVAASAFMQLENIPPRKRVFLIGSSHHRDFNGVSIYNMGNYVTPFGHVKVDLPLANELINSSEIINFNKDAHTFEHSLEVLLPFIQYFWKNSFEIIPVILATHSKKTCNELAKILQPYFTQENLFVVSTDLSHYPEYKNAREVDKLTVDATLTGDPEILLEQIENNKKKYIPNLATSMCGWTSVVTLLYLTESINGIQINPILYQNSGDAKLYGDTEKVVGYQSVAFTKKKEKMEFILTNEEKEILLETARKSISSYHATGARYQVDLSKATPNIKSPGGAFVSVYVGKELRGCIGRMQSTATPLIEVVAETAVSAAFHDSRFASITNDELHEASIEISVLTPLKKIHDISEIELGKHGIYIKKDFRTGTFLPQVADKTDWSVEDFLGHCSKNKAGLGWDGWREAELFTYEAIIIKTS
jgi:AmmeMemoRadiSam system protein B/AmmeMemoRadiSam system protein A